MGRRGRADRGVEDALGCSSTAWGAGVRDSARSGSPGADVSATSGVCVVFEVFGEGCTENVKSTIPLIYTYIIYIIYGINDTCSNFSEVLNCESVSQ